jgi:hypothetical protein
MNCDEARARYLAGEENDEALAHLERCSACRSSGIEATRRLLGDQTTWGEPSPELEEQVVALISGHRTSGTRGTRRLTGVIAAGLAAAAIALAIGVYAIVHTASPDWTIDVPGTNLAPSASSTVSGWNTASGTRMVMTVAGLDPAPDGYVYEVWFSRGPAHVAGGTFTADGQIELWVGVARADFPRIWVTLEPLDDDPTPSGVTVLDSEAWRTAGGPTT